MRRMHLEESDSGRVASRARTAGDGSGIFSSIANLAASGGAADRWVRERRVGPTGAGCTMLERMHRTVRAAVSQKRPVIILR
jgi:cobalamin biosynthesis protein CbiG